MLNSMHINVDDASFCDGPKMHIHNLKMPCIRLIVNCFVNTVNACIRLNKANSSDTEALIVLCFVVCCFMSIPDLQLS